MRRVEVVDEVKLMWLNIFIVDIVIFIFFIFYFF